MVNFIRVRVKLHVGKPKRKSKVWIKNLFASGFYNTTKYKEEAGVINLEFFNMVLFKEGPTLFNEHKYEIVRA